MIQKMNQIRPHKGDDSPFSTIKYCNVPTGYRIADIGDSFLLDYANDLDNYFSQYEIVGQTFNDFFRILKNHWNIKQEIVKKYADYDKSKIHYSYDSENKRTVNTSESGSGSNSNSSNNQHIDVPITNDDNTPSTIDDNENSGSNEYSNESEITETVVNDDGDIDRINHLTNTYRSVLAVLIDVFKPCFIWFESYTY